VADAEEHYEERRKKTAIQRKIIAATGARNGAIRPNSAQPIRFSNRKLTRRDEKAAHAAAYFRLTSALLRRANRAKRSGTPSHFFFPVRPTKQTVATLKKWDTFSTPPRKPAGLKNPALRLNLTDGESRVAIHESAVTDRCSPLGGFGYAVPLMLDLGYVREHLDAIEKMARDRGVSIDLDAFRKIDAERREIVTATERKKAERNKASDEIARLKKSGGDASAILARMKEFSEEIKRGDERVAELDAQLREFMLTVPNVPHASVPVGHGAADNVEVRRWGAPPKLGFAPKPHWELGEAAGILDFDAAIKIAGARFAVYKGAGARLERALANFFLDVHTRESGFTEILPPFLVNTASLTGVGQLPKFAADMFHLEGTDLWLTPTAEVELTSFHRDETLDADALPIKMCAWTACFRSEAGAAGKDTRGIKRQHQFQKVELFKFTRPEQSYDELESLVRSAELVLQKLGLHYRVVLLCTGDMGFASAKTYDIEVWLPSAGEFMEISSCSNTEAFQARRSGIRFKPKGGKSEFVHTLNGSGLAVGRTWIAIVENYQQADGSIALPEALRPYMGAEKIEAGEGK
jgi:seryl-tRNA synthetase